MPNTIYYSIMYYSIIYYFISSSLPLFIFSYNSRSGVSHRHVTVCIFLDIDWGERSPLCLVVKFYMSIDTIVVKYVLFIFHFTEVRTSPGLEASPL